MRLGVTSKRQLHNFKQRQLATYSCITIIKYIIGVYLRPYQIDRKVIDAFIFPCTLTLTPTLAVPVPYAVRIWLFSVDLGI